MSRSSVHPVSSDEWVQFDEVLHDEPYIEAFRVMALCLHSLSMIQGYDNEEALDVAWYEVLVWIGNRLLNCYPCSSGVMTECARCRVKRQSFKMRWLGSDIIHTIIRP